MERTLDATLLHLTRTRLLRDYPAQIDACLEMLDDAQIWWRPNEQANAVGNLMLHLAGSNRYYLEQVIAGRDIARNRDEEFTARGGSSKAQVRDVWDERSEEHRVGKECSSGWGRHHQNETTMHHGH